MNRHDLAEQCDLRVSASTVVRIVLMEQSDVGVSASIVAQNITVHLYVLVKWRDLV